MNYLQLNRGIFDAKLTEAYDMDKVLHISLVTAEIKIAGRDDCCLPGEVVLSTPTEEEVFRYPLPPTTPIHPIKLSIDSKVAEFKSALECLGIILILTDRN